MLSHTANNCLTFLLNDMVDTQLDLTMIISLPKVYFICLLVCICDKMFRFDTLFTVSCFYNRFGGTNADYSMFFNATTASEQAAIWSIVKALGESSQYIVPVFPQVYIF